MQTEDNNAQNEQTNDAASNTDAEDNTNTNTDGQDNNDDAGGDTAEKEAAKADDNDGADDKKVEKKKGNWASKRINELTYEREQARAEALAAKEQVQKMLDKMASVQEGDDTEAVKPAKQVNLSDAQIEAKAQEIVAKKEFVTKCNKVASDGKDAFPEFTDALTTLNEMGEHFNNALPFILELTDAHKIINHLGSDPDEAMRIFAMPMTKQAIELAKLEAKMNEPAKSKPVSKAPNPMTTIDGKGKAAPSLDNTKLSTAEWMELREKQQAEKRKRGEKKW